MNPTDSVFHEAFSKLLSEIFEGPPGLVNRWMAGEENPWADADWNASWRITTVTEEQWRALLSKLRQAATSWREISKAKQDWDGLAAAGAISTVAHTAYHLGAIRQILAVASS
jgi:hypothetical protein